MEEHLSKFLWSSTSPRPADCQPRWSVAALLQWDGHNEPIAPVIHIKGDRDIVLRDVVSRQVRQLSARMSELVVHAQRAAGESAQHQHASVARAVGQEPSVQVVAVARGEEGIRDQRAAIEGVLEQTGAAPIAKMK